MKIFKFSCINLWCTKNLVDTQYLLGRIFTLTETEPDYDLKYFTDAYDQDVDFVFLNTCGFLSSGRQEMMAEIEDLLAQDKKIIILWCGAQYFQTFKEADVWKDADAKEEFKEWKAMLKNKNIMLLSWKDFDIFALKKIYDGKQKSKFGKFEFSESPRAYTNSLQWFEYLKIAEGCSTCCTFCIIPKIRWKQRSLEMAKILNEVENMVKSGIKEIILISQDTSRYGEDLYGKPMILDLLEQIENINWNFKYRVLYLYPDLIDLDTIARLKKFKKMVPYFDIPLQHISAGLLKKMWRKYDPSKVTEILENIRKSRKDAFIRTNFIIWFPGETEKDNQDLIDFIGKWYFDNIALFEYHDEPLAASSQLPNKVDWKEINKRFRKVKTVMEKVIDEKNELRIAKEQKWFVVDIVEKKGEVKIIVRPWLHTPEVDPYDEIGDEEILSKKSRIKIWDLIEYKISL